MRKRRRGYNGRRGAPRRKKPTVEVPAPVVPMPRVATGPRTAAEKVKHQAMLDLIARTKERLDRQAERDQRLNERYADEPMIGEPVWHEHSTGKQRP